ncbi:MAG: BF3164 family lipoprotein [Rikenellaceae bacterium]
MKNNLIIFTSLLFFIGCNNNNGLKGERFDDSSFSETVELSAEICPYEAYGTPSMIVCNDSLLFIGNNAITPMVDVVSMTDYKLKSSQIHKGHARNELLICRDILIDYPLIWALDMQQGAIVSYDYDDFVSGDGICDCVDRIALSTNTTANIVKFGSDKFAAINFLRDESITVYDMWGNIDSTTYEKVPYPFEAEKELSLVESIYYYLRKPSYNEQNKTMVVYYNTRHLFEIYDDNLTLRKRVIGPLRKELTSEIDNSYFTYQIVSFTKDYMYLLYQGTATRYQAEGNMKAVNSIVYQFDYDGNPIRKYMLDKAVINMTICENNNAIYALSSSLSGTELLKYKL